MLPLQALLRRTVTLQDSHGGDADGRQVLRRLAAAAAVQRDAASCRNSEIWEVAARRAALIAQEPSVGSSARASLPACRDALANAAAAAVCPPRTDGTVTTAGPLLRFPGLSNELRLSSSGSAPLLLSRSPGGPGPAETRVHRPTWPTLT